MIRSTCSLYSIIAFFLILAGLAPVEFATAKSGDPQHEIVKFGAPTPLEGVRPAQWRVIWTEDPAHRATISWSTAEEGDRHVVYYDTIPRHGNADAYAFKTASYRNGRYSDFNPWASTAEIAFYHHARLSRLKPSTTYYFMMASDDGHSPELHFRTAPVDDRNLTILMGGDSRSGVDERRDINRLIADLSAESTGLLAFAHAGDYVNDGESWDDWSAWLSHCELTVTKKGRILPVIPARGNHDQGPLFDEIFDNPGRREQNYYTTRLGKKIALITLNSEISTGGNQKIWLESQLKSLRGSARWLLTQYHRPIYPAVKSPGAAKPHWTPLFDKYMIDMAYESDGHVIKRTLPIRDDRLDPAGVVYTGEGGLGVKQRKPRKSRWYLSPPGMADRGHHVVMVDFSPLSMIYRVISLDRTIVDSYTFYPKKR